MKYRKMLGLLAVATTALMAFSGPASATTLTSPAGTTFDGFFDANAGHTVLHGSFTSVTCSSSSIEGILWEHGAGITARGPVNWWDFFNCNYSVTVRFKGSLEIHGTGGGNGTVTSTGAEIAIHTSVGECVFTTNGTDIGTLTGGSFAKLDINSAKIPRTGGSFFCGSSATWTGSYSFLAPSPLYVD